MAAGGQLQPQQPHPLFGGPAAQKVVQLFLRLLVFLQQQQLSGEQQTVFQRGVLLLTRGQQRGILAALDVPDAPGRHGLVQIFPQRPQVFLQPPGVLPPALFRPLQLQIAVLVQFRHGGGGVMHHLHILVAAGPAQQVQILLRPVVE